MGQLDMINREDETRPGNTQRILFAPCPRLDGRAAEVSACCAKSFKPRNGELLVLNRTTC